MIHRFTLALIIGIIGATGCNGGKQSEGNKTVQGEAQASDAGETGTETNNPAVDPNQSAEAEKVPLIEQYPPLIGVFPFVAPPEGRAFYLGYSTDVNRSYEIVFGYTVAAVPDFSNAPSIPNFTSEEAFFAFMNEWAKGFQANQAYVDTLNNLATTFAWQVDPAFLSDEAVTIPPEFFSGAPEFVTITQKVFARRFKTLQAGNTSISGTAQAGGNTYQIAVNITEYTPEAVTVGEQYYTTNCVSCHGDAAANQNAFIAHSSDLLARATDVEIQTLIRTSAYPDGSMLNNGTHAFPNITPEEEIGLLGYLRSFPPTFDRIQEVINAGNNNAAAQAASLRLR